MAAPVTGQVTVSGSAQQLDSQRTGQSCAAFTIKAPVTNVNTVYIGPAGVSTATGYPLTPGDEFEYMRQFNTPAPILQLTVGDFYAVGTAGTDVIAWFASV